MASLPATAFDIARLPMDSMLRSKTKVLVVSSVALSFISFWRAGAIVLCDLASTAYYIGGISEQAVGKAAPWFILGVMLFSYAVRSVYVESCTMFTRGGVYKVVKEAMGGSLAKLSVSALMFDYVLTGPISAVAAGQYLVGLVGDMLALVTRHWAHPIIFNSTTNPHLVNTLCVIIALLITAYFWRTNIVGIGESSDKAMKIMKLTTIMAVVIILWSVLTLMLHTERLHLPPLHPVFTADSADGTQGSMGWLAGFPKILGMLGILVAFGHSLLAMSGEESLAQVNREIEAPKLKNLLRAGFVIFLYSMLLTSLVSFFAVLIIPDGKRVTTMIVPNGQVASSPSVAQVDYLRQDDSGKTWGYRIDPQAETPIASTEKVYVTPDTHVERADGGYRDNLINGLVQYLSGPSWLKIGMECFVVIVGFLILAGAVNTSLVGANGVMNRLAEDGVLNDWFLHPPKRFGTTHRLINLVAILQFVTIVASWGDVNTLGEAYAFGVIWSFVFKTLAMVVLRFKDKRKRDYEVPGNLRLGSPTSPDLQIHLPIGITVIFLVLLSTAFVNLATKKTATIWGIGFTIVFLAAFVICERVTRRQRQGKHHEHLEQFNQTNIDSVTPDSVGLDYLNPILVAARGPRSLPMLEKVLHETDTDLQDVVVLTCKVIPARTDAVSDQDHLLDHGDRDLLTKVVTVAEEIGKQVKPVVLPTNDPLFAIARAAIDLKAAQIVLGVSEKMHADMQLEQFALAWGIACSGSRPIKVRILGPQVDMDYALE